MSDHILVEHWLWIKGKDLDLRKITGRLELTARSIAGVVDVIPITEKHFTHPEPEWEGYHNPDEIVKDYQSGELAQVYPMLAQAIDQLAGTRVPATPRRKRYRVASGEHRRKR